MARLDVRSLILKLAAERILMLDGGMGTMLQRHRLQSEDFRGQRFRNHSHELKGNTDLLVLTQPGLVSDVHEQYLAAGSDIIETNSLNAQAISQADYALEHLAYEMNFEAARLARERVRVWTDRTPDKPRFVAGSLGPTNRTLSVSPDVSDPGFRAVTFDQVRDAYAEQVRGLVDGGADLLLAETIFDTLNAKAAIAAMLQVFEEKSVELPIMISVTLDRSGRTLGGQTLEAFWRSVEHARPISFGLNCGFGATQMRPWQVELSRFATTLVTCYPNAGLPNAFGAYDEEPAQTAQLLDGYAEEGLANVYGGCCGTTPEHIRAIAERVTRHAPRSIPERDAKTRYAGLEVLTIDERSNFVMIGERTNVTGSARFRKLIEAGDFDAALTVARDQVSSGANIIDVNMDAAMLDSEQAMTRLLNLVASEPDIARVPVMIDSSRWSVIEAGLKCIAGKPIVNSISLKEGEQEFLHKARAIRCYGAGAVVMAFDEQGQAESAERKFEICARAYRLLTEQAGFPPEDIVFDPNIFAVATGIEGHNRLAMNFIEATRRIKAELPGAKVSGGVSNLSFSFRGNDPVREAFHSAFLYHAIRAGLDMAIVNAGQLAVYEDIPKPLLERVEDVLFDRRPDATERMVEYAETVKGEAKQRSVDLSWREQSVEARVAHALVHGMLDYIDVDVAEARATLGSALAVIEGPMMDGMRQVGELFGAGKMFLPQVVKSARVMKQGVKTLEPYVLRQEGQESIGPQAKIVLATVKGDVHDIGKNIVGVVLGCNNYGVIDLGVMVPPDRILAAVRDSSADMVGLSGLITPSLDEMVHFAEELQRAGLRVPLLIGGATTSRQHTAVKIAPVYEGETVHVLDASRAVGVVAALLDSKQKAQFTQKNRAEQQGLRDQHTQKQSRPLVSYAQAKARAPQLSFGPEQVSAPPELGLRHLGDVELERLVPYIDWSFFFTAWELKGRFPRILESPEYGAAARELYDNGRRMLDRLVQEKRVRASGAYGLWRAHAEGDDIVVFGDAEGEPLVRFNMLRQQQQRSDGQCFSLADFVAPAGQGVTDHVGAFAVTSGLGASELAREFEQSGDDYGAIMVKALADRLAEAFAEMLHERVRHEWYEQNVQLTTEELIAEKFSGIRPAFGYPACPDHSEKIKLFDLLDARSLGMDLTESCVMTPAASVSGLYLGHPGAHYFTLGRIGRDQVLDYARRKGMPVAEVERWLGPNLGYEPGGA
ncbi:MAG: methionine synthase [Polyangiaceae bacterium]|nr:methionine synthase [Polyangiaceae bacterium]